MLGKPVFDRVCCSCGGVEDRDTGCHEFYICIDCGNLGPFCQACLVEHREDVCCGIKPAKIVSLSKEEPS